MNDVHYSSATDMWETPQPFFDVWNAKFRFDWDVCATDENAKCAHYYTKENDGLSKRWVGTVWMNPPYGKEIIKWMKKAYESARDGDATVVCLIPARTDTAWWHDYAMKGEITFIRGRLKFGNAENSAPFPSAVVVFEQEVKGRK
jgi:phage N-6-adenine-methyltransferase